MDKIVILVNELSQSLAEVIAMKYRNAPNAIIIGSQIADAAEYISKFVLPGGIGTRVTATETYFLDGVRHSRLVLLRI